MPSFKPSEELRRAGKLASSGKVAEARRIYTAILQAYPGNKKARQAIAALPRSAAPLRTSDPDRGTLIRLMEMLKQGELSALSAKLGPLLIEYPASVNLHNIDGLLKKEAGDVTGAVEAFRKVVELSPDLPEGRLHLGSALHLDKRYSEAEVHLRKAIALRPDMGRAYAELGDVLKAADLPDESIPAYQRASELMPDRPEIYLGLGAAHEAVNDLEAALNCYDKVISGGSSAEDPFGRKGALLIKMNRKTEAQEALGNGLRIAPLSGNLHRLLASVTKYTEDDPHLAKMLEVHEDTSLLEESRSELCYAIAKAFEDIGDLDKSFTFLKEAGAARKQALGYDIGEDRELFRKIKSAAADIQRIAFTPQPSPGTRPIFILGMPRSGTTLVEQIVSAHSRVSAGDELSFVEKYGLDLAIGKKPVSTEALAEFRDKYLRAIARLSGGAPFLTDKLPHNFRFIGLILKAMPEAKIVHIRRDAAAICWSNFQRYFTAKGLGYSYDLQDVVAYFHLYRDLMGYWDMVLPGQVFHVDYETLTREPEPAIRALVEYLGLPWEDACLSPEKNERVSRTASTLQVRRPIYTGSSKGWRRYEPFLDGAFDDLPAS